MIVPQQNSEGTYIIKPNGKLLTKRVIHPDNKNEVVQAFRRFAQEGWSPQRIARDFCLRKVGGSNRWDRSSIVQILKREVYVGVEFDEMTSIKKHPETGAKSVIHNPPEQWLRREVPEMRIIDDELWQMVQRKLKECSEAYSLKPRGPSRKGIRKGTRTHCYPRTLVRPMCSTCKKELHFGSAGKYSTFCCPNGSKGKNGCSLRTYKSTRVIEKCLTNFLLAEVFTQDFLMSVVNDANTYLEEERNKPKKVSRDDGGIKALVAKRDHLASTIELHSAQDVSILINRLRDIERQIEEIKKQQARELVNELPVPAAITMREVAKLVTDLSDLLKDDVAKAAPLLRDLLGDIEVNEVAKSGSKRPIWSANFTLNAVPFMLTLANSGKLPNTEVWEYLTLRSWKFSKPVVVAIKDVPIYEEIAPKVMALKRLGISDEVIAHTIGETTSNVFYARNFAEHGIRPKSGPTRKPTGTGVIVKYKLSRIRLCIFEMSRKCTSITLPSF